MEIESIECRWSAGDIVSDCRYVKNTLYQAHGLVRNNRIPKEFMEDLDLSLLASWSSTEDAMARVFRFSRQL